jgi:hypothetical protein
MHTCNWKVLILVAMLCIDGSARAAPHTATNSPVEADVAAEQSIPPVVHQESDRLADTDGTKVPEPQGLLLVAMATCGLTAIHLRRRWG